MRHLIGLFVLLTLAAVLLAGLATRLGPVPPPGDLLDPAAGLYRTARHAEPPREARLALPATLDGPVTVVRDGRSVPHIFAGSDRDAVVALGYVVAQDRLFQLDFMPRVAAGRMAEVFGPGLVETDRYLRRTGMEDGARANLRRLQEEGGIEADLLAWFAAGVNAYLAGLDAADLPLEFRLLGYAPEPWGALQTLRVLQYMAYDLSYGTDSAVYGPLRERLGEAAFGQLFPRYASLYSPIVPGTGAQLPGDPPPWTRDSTAAVRVETPPAPALPLVPEDVPGKGSNAWAVAPARSATGGALLANDMHLGLSLPAVFYECHLVTPTMDVYGGTIPGAPLPVAGFNRHVAWGFTNTGADQLDHYRLTLDPAGTRYRFDGRWLDLDERVAPIHVAGEEAVLDTVRYSHWGPLVRDDSLAVAVQWTAHRPSRSIRALWGFAHADDLGSFEAALRFWDTPMQNVHVATADGDVAVRSSGVLPLRRGGTGAGLLDGQTRAGEWVGQVDFEELPHATNPPGGFFFSANQPPAGPPYPYYLGADWREGFRSVRLHQLLGAKDRHSPDDFARYQRDVHVLQRDLFVPFLEALPPLPGPSERLRQMLAAWDGAADLDRPEPLVLDHFLEELERLAWDEFAGPPTPALSVLYWLLRDEPTSPWLDVRATPRREVGPDLLRGALAATADTLALRYGPEPAAWRWGDHHAVVFRHLTQSEALEPLWRGPVPYPGFGATLSPAGGRLATHSAAWRMIVDFGGGAPRARGIYPGGQSGNPFSRYYDYHLPEYVAFRYYDFLMPRTPGEVEAPTAVLELVPR